jgi:hypothetical protein
MTNQYLMAFVLLTALLLPLISANINIAGPVDGATINSNTLEVDFTYLPATNPGPRGWTCAVRGGLAYVNTDYLTRHYDSWTGKDTAYYVGPYVVPTPGVSTSIHLSNIPSGTYQWFLRCEGHDGKLETPIQDLTFAPTAPTTANVKLPNTYGLYFPTGAYNDAPEVVTSQHSYSFPIIFYATDSGLMQADCEILVDGKPVGSQTVQAEVSTTINGDLSALDQTREHSWQAKCNANHPNFPIYSLIRPLVVRDFPTTGPSVALQFPKDNSVVAANSDVFIFHYDAAGTGADASCRMYLDGWWLPTPVYVAPDQDVVLNIRSFQIQPLLPDGKHHWVVTCVDKPSEFAANAQFQIISSEFAFDVNPKIDINPKSDVKPKIGTPIGKITLPTNPKYDSGGGEKSKVELAALPADNSGESISGAAEIASVTLIAPEQIPLGNQANLQLQDRDGQPVFDVQILAITPNGRTVIVDKTDARGQTSFVPEMMGQYTYTVVGPRLTNRPTTDVTLEKKTPVMAGSAVASSVAGTGAATAPNNPWPLIAILLALLLMLIIIWRYMSRKKEE